MEVLYEDNHIIVVNKRPGEIVQGDKTGDATLGDAVKQYLKDKYNKPGAVFLGVTHRLDRPVGGAVVFAKTSKALSRINEMFRTGRVHKTYWAVVRNAPRQPEALLENHLYSVGRNNKTYVAPRPDSRTKQARLRYRTLARGDRYTLLEVELLTGRKHQIRAQLAAIGSPIKGDLKYGDKRSNPDGGISLWARHIDFVHPVSGIKVDITAPLPDDTLWQALEHRAALNTVTAGAQQGGCNTNTENEQ